MLGTRIPFPVVAGPGQPSPSQPLRVAELLASVSLATDLGMGQPLGHALRTCAIATALAEALGFGREERRTVHQFALLRFLGCTSDAAETAAMAGGDDRAYFAAMSPVAMGSGRELLRRHVQSVAVGRPRPRRLRLVARSLADPKAGACLELLRRSPPRSCAGLTWCASTTWRRHATCSRCGTQ